MYTSPLSWLTCLLAHAALVCLGTPLQQAVKQLGMHTMHTFDPTQVIPVHRHCLCCHHTFDGLQVFGSKKNGDMAMVVLRKGLVQGKQTNLQIVQTIVGSVLDKGFGGGDCLFSGANIDGGGAAAAATAATAKLPGGSGGAPEVMEWAEYLSWGWSAALRAGDALLLLQVMASMMLVMMMKTAMLIFVLLLLLASGRMCWSFFS